MPLRALTCFASHKGGTGKTLLSVQSANTIADANPSENVLFIDLTELGDGSKRLLGGLERLAGHEDQFGQIFSLLDAARAEKEGKEGVGGFIRGMFGRGGGGFKIEDFAMRVADKNPNSGIPENLYLITSGGDMIDAAEVEEASGMRSHADRRKICDTLRRAMMDSGASWRVIIDTDGDRRPNPLTRLGYLLADYLVVPIQADEADFQRIVQMIHVLAEIKKNGEADTVKIALVAWNKVQVWRSAPSEVGWFSPPKVTVDTIKSLNDKVQQIRAEKPFLFSESFDTVLVKDLPDTVAAPSNANGLPFCRMCAGKVGTRAGITFDVKKDQIQSCAEQIDRIVERLNPDAE